MEFINKRQKKKVIWISAFYITIILLSIFFLFEKGFGELHSVYIVNISVDIFAMILGYVLFVCCIMDVQKTGLDYRYYLYLINVAFLGLFTDSIAWIVNEVPKLRNINILDNTFYFMCAPIGACFFWLYTMTYLKLDKKIIQALGKIVKVGLFFSVGLRVINLFTKAYFSVDSMGVYSRGPYYDYSMIYTFFVMGSALVAVMLERKKLQRYQIVTFFVYALGPIAVGVFTMFIYGLSLSYPIVMLVLLLMYCLLNVSQGKDKAIADRDLLLASSIQEHVLPSTFPYMPERDEFDLYATMSPAKEVGGDFYDFFMIDDDNLALVIADVSGKGIPAALFMMVSRTLIKNQTLYAKEIDPKKILGEVNDQLCEGNDMELFVTAWLGILTISTGKLRYANAGHEYPAVCKAGGLFEVVKEKHSPPLAAIEGMKFRGAEVQLSPGDTIYVYTDGVTEATNSFNQLFDINRMVESLNRNKDKSVKEINEGVRDDIDKFVGDAAQFDDITMLCIRYYGKT